MQKRFVYPRTSAIQVIDSIPVPRALLEIAREQARETKKIHFIGVFDEPNPNHVERSAELEGGVTDLGIPTGFGLPTGLEPNARLRITGEYILSDDRAEVLAAGCGRLVWVTGRTE